MKMRGKAQEVNKESWELFVQLARAFSLEFGNAQIGLDPYGVLKVTYKDHYGREELEVTPFGVMIISAPNDKVEDAWWVDYSERTYRHIGLNNKKLPGWVPKELREFREVKL